MHTSQNGHNTPEKIEDLGTGSFFYNFNIEKTEEGHKYNQLRFDYPIDYELIKQTILEKGLTENE